MIDNRPTPKFSAGDIVMTSVGIRIIQGHGGYRLVDGVWIPTYRCGLVTKKGKIDNRQRKTLSFINWFLETELTKGGV